MKTLVCVNPFGHFKPGDEITGVPDEAVFDTAYFAVKDAEVPAEAPADKENNE